MIRLMSSSDPLFSAQEEKKSQIFEFFSVFSKAFSILTNFFDTPCSDLLALAGCDRSREDELLCRLQSFRMPGVSNQ